MKIGFIGCGNMAKAMIAGIIKKGVVAPADIMGTNSRQSSADAAAQELGINTSTDNLALVDACDYIFLSVKPQMYEKVIAEIKDHVIGTDKVIITVAPGKTVAWLTEHFGGPVQIIRTAPNTPALVGEGLTGYYADPEISEERVTFVVSLLESLGETVAVAEKLIDVIGAVGGSSPAFIYVFIEALADGGVAEGLPRDVALKVSAQAVLGSAKMVLETGEHPGTLKDRVCSPGGSTIKGIEALELRGYRGTITNAIRTTTAAARKL